MDEADDGVGGRTWQAQSAPDDWRPSYGKRPEDLGLRCEWAAFGSCGGPLHWEHRIAKSRCRWDPDHVGYEPDVSSNIGVACAAHNLNKGGRTVEEYERALASGERTPGVGSSNVLDRFRSGHAFLVADAIEVLRTTDRFLGGPKNNGEKYAAMLEASSASDGVTSARYVGRGHAFPLHPGNLEAVGAE